MSTSFGNKGEETAAKLLQKKGYKIVVRNLRNLAGEIDIVATKDKCLYFIEVKTRKRNRYGLPEQAVNSNKLTRIRQAGLLFRSNNEDLPERMQIQVLSILIQGGKIRYKLIDVEE